MLYHLAITTAATGLRISDAAMLRFQDCNLVNGVVTLTTIKTGSKVGIPIFDYDPSSPNYEPELGEFRRHLETALAEVGDREAFVCPQAANLYKKIVRKGGKLTYPGRDAIYARGKALFARALFTDELKITEADFTQTKTPDEIRHEIAASKWSEEKKQRTTVIFSLYADGQSYNDIVKATRHPKSTISADLTAVETLTRSAIKRQSDYPSLRKLLPYTRKERAFGMRSASLYSWHSMRCTFVVRMLSNGVDLETLRAIVGHATVEQTLEYYNPTTKIAAENARRVLAKRSRPTEATDAYRAFMALWQQLDRAEQLQAISQLKQISTKPSIELAISA